MAAVTAVTASIDGSGVCRIVLNRPDALNALNDDVRRSLQTQLTALADDASVRVVSIEGAGRAFSAGADLRERPAGASDADWAARRHRAGAWQRLLELLESIPQVTVARLHGHVIGGAVLLAAACDIRIAADDATFRIPELAIGIPLTWSGNPRLAREIGLPLTRDLVLTGRSMGAAEAKACGLVQRLVAPSELDDAHAALIDELLAMPSAPLAMTRAMFAAMGRERMGSTAWADADLLMWSGREDESAQAALGYAERHLRR